MNTSKLLKDAEYCKNECLIFKANESLQAKVEALQKELAELKAENEYLKTIGINTIRLEGGKK